MEIIIKIADRVKNPPLVLTITKSKLQLLPQLEVQYFFEISFLIFSSSMTLSSAWLNNLKLNLALEKISSQDLNL